MFTCQTHSRLRWTIQFEDISESNFEHVHLSGDQQRTTTIQHKNGIQFTFNLTTSDTNSSLLESTMTVIANHTLLNRAVVNCVGAGGVTTNTVIHMRGIKIVQRVWHCVSLVSSHCRLSSNSYQRGAWHQTWKILYHSWYPLGSQWICWQLLHQCLSTTTCQ